MAETIRIKKYGNRRLYDTHHKRYITLDELTTLIQDGYVVEIADAKTGEDLTNLVLMQLLMESQRGGLQVLFTSDMLHKLIQYQDQAMIEFFQGYLPRIFSAYVDWQQQTQEQFMQWANMSWGANRMTQDWMNPAMNWWNRPNRPEPANVDHNSDQTEEIEALKAKLSQLEAQLKPQRRKRSS